MCGVACGFALQKAPAYPSPVPIVSYSDSAKWGEEKSTTDERRLTPIFKPKAGIVSHLRATASK